MIVPILLMTIALSFSTFAKAEVKRLWFGASAIATNDVECRYGHFWFNGIVSDAINCEDNRGSIFGGEIDEMEGPDKERKIKQGYDGGPITMSLRLISNSVTPIGIFSVDVQAKCAPYGSKLSWSITKGITTDMFAMRPNEVRDTKSVTLSPNGVCGGRKPLSWRAQVDEVSTTTQTRYLSILGVMIEYHTK